LHDLKKLKSIITADVCGWTRPAYGADIDGFWRERLTLEDNDLSVGCCRGEESERGNELQVELTSHHRIFDLQGHFAASRQGTDHILGSKWHQPRQNSQLLNMATCSHLGGSNINTSRTNSKLRHHHLTFVDYRYSKDRKKRIPTYLT
jgi:hypothetical protein